jgi:Omp85 superfamily domain
MHGQYLAASAMLLTFIPPTAFWIAISTLCISTLLSGRAAQAQSTRREALDAERAKKAQALTAPKPSGLEKKLLTLENDRVITRILAPYEGLYLKFGGLTKGGGLGAGPGYRNWFWGDRAVFNSYVVASFRNYWSGTAEVVFPKLADERLVVGGHGYYRYWPRERFYGLGRDSSKDDRTSFLRKGYEFRGDATYSVVPVVKVGGITAFRHETIDEGHAPGFPSIEEVFTPVMAPGLERQPDYLWSGAFVDVDYRDQRKNTRSGGHFRVSYDLWHDLDDFGFSYRDLQFEALHAFPIFDKKRVLIARLIAESTDSPDGNVVPFYAQPTLGGSTTLRGFDEFRFRDRNVVLINAEYRWEAFSGLDMALFGDWGDVGPTWDDIDFDELKSDYGIGFRFNTFRSVFLRIDLARSRQEGFRVTTSFSGAF